MLKVLPAFTTPVNKMPLIVKVTVSPDFTSPLTVPVTATEPRVSVASRMLSAVILSIVIVAVTSSAVALVWVD